MTDRQKMAYTRADLGRCFPREGVEWYCYEYDGRMKTMNFGPPSKMQKKLRNGIGIKLEEAKPSPHVEKTISIAMSNENITYFIHPSVESHVGLDTSMFGWLLPHNPIIFSMFCDPLERLLSSFHHGIRYGANRPGSVKPCVWDKGWQKNVAEARKLVLVYNDTTSYQKMPSGISPTMPRRHQERVHPILRPAHQKFVRGAGSLGKTSRRGRTAGQGPG